MSQKLRFKPGHLIWRAYQLTWQIFAEEAGSLDITPVQEALLLVLADRADIDQKTLAELVALDRSTAGNVIERLERRGFVRRAPNDLDRRARLVRLTPRGVALSRKLSPVAQHAAERLMTPLTLFERTEFTRLLRKITGLADQFDQNATPSATTRLNGKKILCVGLTDTFGQTIIQRLRSDGAHVIELAAPNIQDDSVRDFERQLKAVLTDNNGLEVFVNGGNLIPETTTTEWVNSFARVQAAANMRSFTIECLLPYLVNGQPVRLINLALFPSADARDESAIMAANMAISSLSIQVNQKYHPMGIVSNCISPRFQCEPLKSQFELRRSGIAHVSAADAGLAVSYLASDEARSVSASNIILG